MTTTQELPAQEREALRAEIMRAMSPLSAAHSEWRGWPGTWAFAEAAIRVMEARARLAAQVEPQREQRLERALADMEARKDGAYEERNKVVAALAKVFPSGIARTAIEGWSEDWHGCVYIDLPTGQVSWHFHDSQAHLFAGLPPYTKPWDGHDTPEKYRRLAALYAHPPVQQEQPDTVYPAQPSGEAATERSDLDFCDALILADGYRGGSCITGAPGGGGTVRLHYRSDEQAEAAFDVITTALDALSSTPAQGDGGGVKTVEAPSLWPVIRWLEAGCDPQWAAKELRVYAERLGQPDTSGEKGPKHG